MHFKPPLGRLLLARGGDRCRSRSRVFHFGRGVAVLPLDGIEDSLTAALIELVILAQQLPVLRRDGRGACRGRRRGGVGGIGTP